MLTYRNERIFVRLEKVSFVTVSNSPTCYDRHWTLVDILQTPKEISDCSGVNCLRFKIGAAWSRDEFE